MTALKTRRAIREAEAHRAPAPRPAVDGKTTRSARGTALRSTSAIDPVYRRRGTRVAGIRTGIRNSSWKKRVGSTVLVGGLAASGLWMLGGSAAHAEVTTSGTLALVPGGAAQADTGIKYTDGTGSALFAVPGPVAGGGLYLGLQTRSTAGNAYVAKVRVWADGRVTVGLSSKANGGGRRFGDAATSVKVTGPAKLNVETSVAGSSPVRLAVRTWVEGTPKPAWQLTALDADVSRNAAEGGLRTWAYLSSSAAAGISLPFSNVTQSGVQVLDPAPLPPPVAQTPPATSTPKPTPTVAPTTKAPKPTPKPTKPDPDPTKAPTQPSNPGGMPSAGNTGVPSGTNLKVHQGDLTITKAGATYDKLDIHGFVNVQAPNVTITRSIIRGASTTANRGVVNATNGNVKNFVLEDSEIRVDHPSITVSGIEGGNFTIRRVEVDGGVDTVHAFKDNVKIESSWLHGTDYYVGSGGPTHNDGVQVMGGRNIVINGSRIEGADNAAIMVTQDAAATSNLSITNNWLNDGGCSLNIVPKKLDRIGPITLTGNKFGGKTRVANCAVAVTSKVSLVASNNTWAANGSAAKINVWG